MKNNIRNTAVKITVTKDENTNLGSGTIVTKNNRYYILTAEHCIYGTKENRELFRDVTIENISIEYRQTFDDVSICLKPLSIVEENEKKDFLILEIEQPAIEFDFTSINFGYFVNDNDQKLYFRAYSKVHPNEPRTYYSTLNEQSQKKFLCKLKDDTFSQPVDYGLDVAGGISGSGLFHQQQNKLYLVGVIRELRDKNGTFDDFFATSIEEITLLKGFLQEIKEEKSELQRAEELLLQLVRPNTSSLNNELQKQLKEELDNYFVLLEQFKPKTALGLLDRFSMRLSKMNDVSIEILAFVEYQKGYCYKLLYEVEKANDCFVKAYKQNTGEILYKEKALEAYSQKKEIERVNFLITEILKDYPYNPRAWGVRFQNTKEADIKDLINRTPDDVRKNVTFQQIVFYHFYKQKESQLFEHEKNIFPSLSEIGQIVNDFELSIHSLEQGLFLVSWLYTTYIRGYNYIDFYSKPSDKDKEIFRTTCLLLDKIELVLADSEIPHNELRSMQHFANYIAYDKKDELLLSVKDIKDKSLENNKIYYQICANQLLKEKEYSSALDILHRLEAMTTDSMETFAILSMISYIYGIQAKWEENAQYLIKNLTNIQCVTESISIAYVNSIYVAYLIGKLDQELVDKIKQIDIESSKFKELIDIVLSVLIEGSTQKYEVQIDELLDIFSSNNVIMMYIGNLYSYTAQHSKAIKIYKRNIDRIKKSPRELLQFIKSLANSQEEETVALALELCAHWRTNYPLEENILRIEYNLRYCSLDWEKMLEITKIGYENTDTEFWLYHIIFCLDKLDDNEICKYLDIYIKLDNIPINSFSYIVDVLIRKYDYDLAVDLTYKYSENPEVKMMLFQLYLEYNSRSKSRDKFIDYDQVVEGAYVTYRYENKEYTICIDRSSDNKAEAEIASLMMGKKVGDEILQESQLTRKNKVLRILKITDKYLHKHLEVYANAGNPASGLGIEQFTMDPTDPIGSLEQIFGCIDKERIIDENNIVNQYYNWEISLLQLSLNFSEQGTFWGTEILSRTRGVNTIPIREYLWDNDITNKRFILDFTSIYTFYILKQQYNVKLPRFVVSKHIVEILKEHTRRFERDPYLLLQKISALPQELKIDTSAVTSNPVNYLKSVINWIENDNDVQINDKTADLLKSLNFNLEEGKLDPHAKFLMDYIVSIICLLEQDRQTILITDDPMSYIQFGRNVASETISTESFVKATLGNESKETQFFIENRYLGYTYSTTQLISLYKDKTLSESHVDIYNFTIENIGIWNLQSCFDLCLYILNTTKQIDDLTNIVHHLHKNSLGKHYVVNVIREFLNRYFILNIETQQQLNMVLSSVFYSK